ncbi:MAG: divergent PAP2 family protein [Candidatus Moranbacteria bacterium]|nr:divergent PAP2 family protein [Candidatus Moranbacteria bacterium]
MVNIPIIHGYNVVIIPILVGLITQTIKFVVFTAKNGLKWEYFFTHGHMPSSHTAFAVATLTSIGYYEGTTNGVFALACIFSFIIIDDALRLRMYLGDQGRYLNMLVDQLNIDKKKFPRLKERIGHRLNEVIVGGIVGFVLTILLAKILG